MERILILNEGGERKGYVDICGAVTVIRCMLAFPEARQSSKIEYCGKDNYRSRWGILFN
jgi:hypothetical protein